MEQLSCKFTLISLVRCNAISGESQRGKVVLSLHSLPFVVELTGQFADQTTRDQSSRRLVNSRTSQLADSDFLVTVRLHYFYTV